MAVRAGTHGRHIVDQGQLAGALVHRFLQVAVADADLLGGRAGEEDPRDPRLHREHMVVARVRGDGPEVARGDAAAAETVAVVGEHLELGEVVDLAGVLQREVLAPTTEVVPVAHRLEGIVVVLRLGQAARHIGVGVVVVEVGRQLVAVGELPMGLEQHVIDIVVVVAVAVVGALHPGIQQRHAQAVVGGPAEERLVELLPAAVAGMLDGGADFAGELLRNRPGHEVDHPADVLRAVAHRAGAAHDVDTLQVADGQRHHRQLRLAVGRHRRRHAVDHHRRARRQA